MTELAKTHEITLKLPLTGTSSQPKADEEALFVSRIIGQDIIEPPEDLRLLAALTSTARGRRSLIDAVSRNTVGMGYRIDRDQGHEHDDVAEEELIKVEHTLEALARRDTRSHQPSFTELLYRVKWDEEETGNGYLEVSRSRLTGQIDGLFHVPGARVRRLRDRDGWVLLPPDYMGTSEKKVIRFYNFGEKVTYGTDHAPIAKLESGRRWARNELIAFQLYTSESSDYGLPRDVALAEEYAGDKMAGQTNLSFFDSSGTPPKVIFVQGERQEGPGGSVHFTVPPDITAKMGELIKSDGGAQKRVGIIPLPPGTTVTDVELGKISDRDIGFTEYRKSITQMQLGAFRVSPIFVSATVDGRYTAEVERAITLEQVFDPEQRRYEDRLHQSLMKDLGVPQTRVRFKRLAVEGDATKRESARALADKNAITNREYRAAHGLGPLPEAGPGEDTPDPADPMKKPDLGGKVPHGWNDQLVGKTSEPDPNAGREDWVEDGNDQRGLRPRLAGRQPVKEDPALNGDKPIVPAK